MYNWLLKYLFRLNFMQTNIHMTELEDNEEIKKTFIS